MDYYIDHFPGGQGRSRTGWTTIPDRFRWVGSLGGRHQEPSRTAPKTSRSLENVPLTEHQ
jgi:hypothetical protein